VGIHAHPLDAALTLEEGLLPITLAGKLSWGEPFEAEVFLPHPYTFLVMKISACRDRLGDPDKEFGRYHALDLYSILATTTESEWRYALGIRVRFEKEPYIMETGRLVIQYFSTMESPGIIRLRESPYYRSALQLGEFMSALKDLFCES